MYRLLYDQHDILCERFIEKYHVLINEIIEGIEGIEKLYQIIRENESEEFEDMKGLFIEMAVYYGNALCNAFKGKWVWDDDRCRIILHDRYGKVDYCPLRDVIVCWKNNRGGNYLMILYNELL